MDDYYEELWERLPAELTPPDLDVREPFALAHIAPGDRVLDLGCGAGAFSAILSDAGAVVIAVDVAAAALARARARVPGLDARPTRSGEPLPLEDSAVDVVWASEVIEHVADTARWLSEVRRVLVPRGQLLITTPSHGRLRVALAGVERFSAPFGDHLHLYTRRSLTDTLTEFAFSSVRVRTAGGPPGLRRLLLARATR